MFTGGSPKGSWWRPGGPSGSPLWHPRLSMDGIGQGTYSNVYCARELKSNRIVAVKKVRFDNFQAESVRFMEREIMILRMLDHPNVMKLDGIITSKLSSTIYLVFEYMEHDLVGLLLCPDITFSESQVKCLMRQVLSGLDHCHSRYNASGHQVEQLHKIFRLCVTPPEEYWRMSQLALASMFKPQHPYDSTLRERCSELPKGVVDLIESLLAIQVAKRGTAASALDSENFKMRPYACDPFSMPNSPQTKRWMLKPEKTREGFSSNSRRLRKESSDLCKAVGCRNNNKQSLDTKSDVSAASNSTQDSITSTKSVPVSIAQHSISVSISQK
ncbi:hypothetical protein SASPL_133435 [Salvia splendens]|uniref:Protein kinase domain-containing protein n=1 Tax=Salvia splendens TaxID=180675 RepID=A0A8X8X5J9_SALSN|nr:hypothetical protein SASPL_133435 [Salvia splendens]